MKVQVLLKIINISFLLYIGFLLCIKHQVNYNPIILQTRQSQHDISSQLLDHINEYGLKLIQLNASKSNKSVFVHVQNPHYRVHYESHLIESELCWSEKTGLGNVLSQYWGARAIAYFLNYNFKWTTCNMFTYLPKYNGTDKYFSSFLPKQKNTYHKTGLAQNLMVYADRNKIDASYIFTSSLLFLYYNKYYAHIMNYDYENAFKQFYKANNKQPQFQFSSDGDTVIHIRCGDIFKYMSMKHNVLPQYGLLTANYIKYSVTNATNIAFNIDWIKDKISENTTIFISSQLTNANLRKHEKQYAKQCRYLVTYLVENSLKTFFQPAKIEIMYDTDINDDFYLMMNAPLLICSPSSFCLAAAMANTNGYSIMPSFGSWNTNLNDITNIMKNYSDVYSSDRIARHSKYLPQKHVIVESMKTKWHINDFIKFNYNISRLSQYIVDH